MTAQVDYLIRKIEDPAPWQDQAACQGWPPEWWTHRVGQWRNPQARKVCRSCPVAAECLEFQLDFERDMPRSERWGIFGNTTPGMRAKIQAQRDRGKRVVRMRVERAV